MDILLLSISCCQLCKFYVQCILTFTLVLAEWSTSPRVGPDGELCSGKRKTKAAAYTAMPA